MERPFDSIFKRMQFSDMIRIEEASTTNMVSQSAVTLLGGND